MTLIRKEAFRVNRNIRQKLVRGKRRIQYRLRERQWDDQPAPMFTARNIRYDLADRARGLACGGIGAMHLLARRSGLIEAIDRRLHLLKLHKPYHESDHVLNIAYNILCGGSRLEHIELRRNDEVYTDALGAQRIPDPTTAGDFCRRFEPVDVEILMETINDVRLKIWRQQSAWFFQEAIIEADGTLAPTTGECKQGMDINYKGQWGYQPLVVSLANTNEPLYLVNRRGSRPSHEGAAARFDQAIALCRRAGFKRILLRGGYGLCPKQTSGRLAWPGRAVHLRPGCHAQPGRDRGKPGKQGLGAAPAGSEVHRPDRASRAAGQGEGGHRAGPGLREHPAAIRGRGRV